MDLVAGKYLLLQKLASGGMAELFLAKEMKRDGTEKQVVLKRILPHLAEKPDYVHMFLDEAKTAVGLCHPNVVYTFDVGQEGGSYFMVMEYLQGEDLRAIIKKVLALKKPIPLPQAVGIIIAGHGCRKNQLAVDLLFERAKSIAQKKSSVG